MNIQGNIKTIRTSLFSIRTMRTLLVATTVVLGILYIWQVNVTATRGFAMRDLEKDIESLRIENDRLQMDVAKLQSADSVTTRMQMLGLTKVSNIEYITPGVGSVAINR